MLMPSPTERYDVTNRALERHQQSVMTSSTERYDVTTERLLVNYNTVL